MAIDPRRLASEAQSFVRWFVRLPTEQAFDDLFTPAFWAPCAQAISTGDIVRAQRADLAWDIELVCTAKVAGGLRIERYPREPKR